MLRKKFLVVLGAMVSMLLALALTAIVLLHGVLRDLDAVSESAMAGASAILDLRAALDYAMEAPADHSRIEPLARRLDALGTLESEPGREALARRDQMRGRVEQLRMQLDPSADRIGVLWAFREDLDRFTNLVNANVEDERRVTIGRFRVVALSLGLVFVLVINIFILIMSRMVSMVVKPVDRLVEASRRLAMEEFDYRVPVDRADEFGELARAYNSLASQLEANEARKIDTLHQVACTLNHELNNTIAIIEFQLALLARATRGDNDQAERLREIHQSLARISRTVAALARVRRIVLTDYSDGVRMLDLEQSLETDDSTGGTVLSSGF